MSNQYFWNFVKNDFSKFDTQDVDHVPVVDFEFPDKTLLTDIYEISKNLLDYFEPLPGSKMYDDWYREPTEAGHSHLPLIDSGQKTSLELHSGKIVERRQKTLFSDNSEYEVSGLKQAINKLNDIMPMTDLCDIHVCKAKGWLHPHIDVKDDKDKLRIWIPLHEFPTCLKVFPFGWVSHQLGKGYLFDNKNYVHAVYNPADFDRYVLIAGIDTVNPPSWIAKQLDQNRSHWRSIFQQEYSHWN